MSGGREFQIQVQPKKRDAVETLKACLLFCGILVVSNTDIIFNRFYFRKYQKLLTKNIHLLKCCSGHILVCCIPFFISNNSERM